MSHLSSDRGVLTATDWTFFPAVHATAISLREQGIPYAVVDHGLMAGQRVLLERQGVQLMEDCEKKAHRKTIRELVKGGPPNIVIAPRAWHKPCVCQRSPFKHTVWIDADAIPIQATELLFEQGSFVTRDHFVSQEWAMNNERRLLKGMGGRVSSEWARINLGVFGFKEDDEWIEGWRATCEIILTSPLLTKRALCRDQSAFIAMQSLSSYENGWHHPLTEPTIIDDPIFNYPADGLNNENARKRLDCPSIGLMLLGMTRDRHPDALVVHWMGTPKPWQSQSKSKI